MKRENFITAYVLKHEHMPRPELLDTLIQEGCIEVDQETPEPTQENVPLNLTINRGSYISFNRPVANTLHPQIIFPAGFIFDIKKINHYNFVEESYSVQLRYKVERIIEDVTDTPKTHEYTTEWFGFTFDCKDAILHDSNKNNSRMVAEAVTYRKNKFGNRCPNTYNYYTHMD